MTEIGSGSGIDVVARPAACLCQKGISSSDVCSDRSQILDGADWGVGGTGISGICGMSVPASSASAISRNSQHTQGSTSDAILPSMRLRFTKTGDPKLEDAYARHFAWPGKSPFRFRPEGRPDVSSE